ncbi:MAG: MBL fold metallo-hydrolase [Bacilli bacterium]|nr:MBL fold metallo-hydrolase [Bacilli bacterium]
MKVCNLASGSTGNCTYIGTENYNILIDLGKTKKYLVDKLSLIGVDYKDIDYVFLTHTHDDHTSAIRTFLKNHKAKLVITQKMFMELKDISDLNIIIYEEHPEIENLDIKSYVMSHDTNDIRSFVITENEKSLVYITDTGYVNSKYFKNFKGKNTYFIESNHDIEMLTHGPYPEWLQKRVLSDFGHLSNKFAGIYLSKLIDENTKNILLLHLSEKNNTESCALDTVKEALSDSEFSFDKIKCAKPNDISEVYII